MDGISPCILKAAIKPSSIIISKLIKKSCLYDYFPDDLKMAKFSLIFKSANMTDHGNYRPISVLPAI